jgi:hypothetical protein
MMLKTASGINSSGKPTLDIGKDFLFAQEALRISTTHHCAVLYANSLR